MKMYFKYHYADVIKGNSIEHTYINGKVEGFEFKINLSYYRGHFLSCIDEFQVYLDGKEIDSKDITFCLNGKQFYIQQLSYCITEFWNIKESATVKVEYAGGLQEGAHIIEVKLILRVPYLPLPGSRKEHDYMPLDNCGAYKFEVQGGDFCVRN